ncbi:hypothetical protein B0H17DRAFT_1193200 [Mycena rosella]|uniref:EthD domain-containing protein n=1 Tax=Mycena rosella TaxID=1033263 RepID=A0AAD7GUN4_MYCRO|nr:hypothetical protein B0H17DRAFT_1193200 [Mycena rosella]
MPPGFLLVTADPGPLVPLAEFQDWYNNEHVPLRLNHLPSFLTGARFRAADGVPAPAPAWLAVYDIEDTATFAHESYTRLRANRSPREAALVKNLALLDRRTYALLADSGESDKATSYKVGRPTPVVLTQWMDEAPKDVGAWRGVQGWVRTRIYECIDNLKSGTGVESGPEAQRVPKYLAVHELLDLRAAEEEAFANAKGVEESRVWALYRAYPCVAQGNVEEGSVA